MGAGVYHAGDGAAAAGLPTPEEVAHDPTVCQNQTYLGHDALRQAHLPIREGGLGLTSSSSIKGAAYIGCHALVLGRVVAASARGNLPSLLERLPERPMASALLEELKIVATEAKRSQIEDAVGSSWAALAAEEDPQGGGIGTLLVEAGAGGGGGRGGGGERGAGGGGGGRGGGGVGQREQWEDPMATQSDREIELSQTTEGSEESAWELYLASNQSSRTPSTHTVGRGFCKISKPKKVRRRRELW